MILPVNLAPLPVGPRCDESAGASTVPFEDFVSLGDVRRVLLGDVCELPVEGLPAEDLEAFAGRSDVAIPSISRWSSDHDIAVTISELQVEEPAIHPAFKLLPPAVRRATPPRARAAEDCEATFGRAKMTDRWWVIGMGLAAAAVLFSGTAVDFISREAVRRSQSGVEPVSRGLPLEPQKAGPAEAQGPEAIAATVSPDEK